MHHIFRAVLCLFSLFRSSLAIPNHFSAIFLALRLREHCVMAKTKASNISQIVSTLTPINNPNWPPRSPTIFVNQLYFLAFYETNRTNLSRLTNQTYLYAWTLWFKMVVRIGLRFQNQESKCKTAFHKP